MEYVEIGDSLDDIYQSIGNGCDTFACPIMFKNHDTMYVDDNGLYSNTEGIIMDGWDYPILGNVLIMGTDIETGDSVDVKTTIEELRGKIKFVGINFDNLR